MTNEFLTNPQGWQCPICKRIYSPMILMCYYCGGEQKTITTVGTSTETNNIETNPMNSYEQFVRKTMEENNMTKSEIIKELYELYKAKVEEATSIWKSECCCISEDEDRDKDDIEELEYFKFLLNKI